MLQPHFTTIKVQGGGEYQISLSQHFITKQQCCTKTREHKFFFGNPHLKHLQSTLPRDSGKIKGTTFYPASYHETLLHQVKEVQLIFENPHLHTINTQTTTRNYCTTMKYTKKSTANYTQRLLHQPRNTGSFFWKSISQYCTAINPPPQHNWCCTQKT